MSSKQIEDEEQRRMINSLDGVRLLSLVLESRLVHVGEDLDGSAGSPDSRSRMVF